jgi:hypothetical protein
MTLGLSARLPKTISVKSGKWYAFLCHRATSDKLINDEQKARNIYSMEDPEITEDQLE